MTQPDEVELVRQQVNRHPNGPTETDEEAVLEQLYGPPDADGFYRGNPAGEE